MPKSILTREDIRKVAPALDHYTQDRLLGDIWKRPGLAPRDRSIVTLAALIARNQTVEMPYHFNLALDNGVKPREVSEIITHLAFYTGWANAMSAVASRSTSLRNAKSELINSLRLRLPFSRWSKLPRRNAHPASANSSARTFLELCRTQPIFFSDLWLRPDLAPRDRSLVTVSALIATGQVAQMPYHLNRAMDNGLTQAEASEAITHLAFYVGWPNAFSALPVAKDVFEKRPK